LRHILDRKSIVTEISSSLDFTTAVFIQGSRPIVFCSDLPTLRDITYRDNSPFRQMDVKTPKQVVRLKGKVLEPDKLCGPATLKHNKNTGEHEEKEARASLRP